EGFFKAFDGFDVDRVAAYGRRERARLLADAAIVRNRLKVDAAIENARRIAALRESHGGFARWLAANHPLDKAEWVKLFKRTFVFTGGEITGEFHQHRLPTGLARRELPGVCEDREAEATLDE